MKQFKHEVKLNNICDIISTIPATGSCTFIFADVKYPTIVNDSIKNDPEWSVNTMRHPLKEPNVFCCKKYEFTELNPASNIFRAIYCRYIRQLDPIVTWIDVYTNGNIRFHLKSPITFPDPHDILSNMSKSAISKLSKLVHPRLH